MITVVENRRAVTADETARGSSTAWDRPSTTADRAIAEAQDILAAVDRQDRLTDRAAMIVRYAPLVTSVVGRLAISLPAVLDHDDLLGYGCAGWVAHPRAR